MEAQPWYITQVLLPALLAVGAAAMYGVRIACRDFRDFLNSTMEANRTKDADMIRLLTAERESERLEREAQTARFLETINSFRGIVERQNDTLSNMNRDRTAAEREIIALLTKLIAFQDRLERLANA
jgi:hypothetical protein